MSDAKHPAGQLLQAYHDGELDEQQTAEIDAHCKQCERCRAELSELAGIERLLADAPAPELPRTVWHRVRPGREQESRLQPAFGIAACAAGIIAGILMGPIEFGAAKNDAGSNWSDAVTVWDSGASASLLDVFQYEQE